jgi:hypothetical protein
MAGVTISAMAMPFPYPNGELKDDLTQRAAWPGWQSGSASWRSHLVISAMGIGPSIKARKEGVAILLRTAATVACTTGANAIGWSGNLLFHPTDSFDEAVARMPLPPNILIRCIWRGPRTRLSAHTVGLGEFDLPEIDHSSTGDDAGAIYNRIMNLSAYLLEHGMVLKDGDTIGVDSRANMQIKHDHDEAGRLLLALQPA